MRFMERYGETNGLVLPRLLNYLIQIKENHFAMLAKLFSEDFKILYFNGNKICARNKFIKCKVELIQFLSQC
jgi:murein tripeptide amidase MpaA